MSVSENTLENKLISGIKTLAPSVDPESIVNSGATNIKNVVSGETLSQVIQAYNNALTESFLVALVPACFCILGTVAIKWKNIKGKQTG